LKCGFARIQAKNKKRGPDRPPARRCTNYPFFPGYLIYIFNTVRSPENFQKKISGTSTRPVPEKKEHLLAAIS
jgi:hypothetical protein